jgi:hypothetical protein
MTASQRIHDTHHMRRLLYVMLHNAYRVRTTIRVAV